MSCSCWPLSVALDPKSAAEVVPFAFFVLQQDAQDWRRRYEAAYPVM